MRNLLFVLSLFPYIAFGQMTATPDPYFELNLIYLGYDLGPIDGYVPTANIDTVTHLYIDWDHYFITTERIILK